MPPGGIRTHNLSRRAAEDLRLRARGHWARRANYVVTTTTTNNNNNIYELQLGYHPVAVAILHVHKY